MKRILKYELSIKEKQEIQLPFGSEIIRVDDIEGKFFLWAVVIQKEDEEDEPETRYLEFYKTGQPIEDYNNLNYLGFCKLFIMQELGLYVFERMVQL